MNVYFISLLILLNIMFTGCSGSVSLSLFGGSERSEIIGEYLDIKMPELEPIMMTCEEFAKMVDEQEQLRKK